MYPHTDTPGFPLAGNFRLLADKINEKPIKLESAKLSGAGLLLRRVREEPWPKILLIVKMEPFFIEVK